MEVADDLVDVDFACDPATLLVLRLNLFCPALLYTHIDMGRVREGPSLSSVGLPHLLTGVAAVLARCWLTAIAGAAELFTMKSCEPVCISFQA